VKAATCSPAVTSSTIDGNVGDGGVKAATCSPAATSSTLDGNVGAGGCRHPARRPWTAPKTSMAACRLPCAARRSLPRQGCRCEDRRPFTSTDDAQDDEGSVGLPACRPASLHFHGRWPRRRAACHALHLRADHAQDTFTPSAWSQLSCHSAIPSLPRR
jgi:hypothetical protein